MKRINLNIACGSTFVVHESWINLDYKSSNKSVTSANLLEPLNFDKEQVNVVYSSHFLEHIPRRRVNIFVGECYRVLAVGGKIRLVLPDLENLCSEYLKCRQNKEHEKADYAIIEIIDQCVRSYPGGFLGEYFKYLSDNPDTQGDMIEYVKKRCGEDLSPHVLPSKRNTHADKSPQEIFIQKMANTLSKPEDLVGKLQCKLSDFRTRLAIALLPKAFREQNVSYASIGEKHAWMWDFYTLSRELEQAGFHDIKRLAFDETEIPGFPLIPLDMTADGSPRKGESSMYIEARK
ncbi:MAG: methyltransferase domain-containing protein [Leptolyngbyaceae cyanobacterium]